MTGCGRAGGSVSHDAGGSPLAIPYRKDVEWLTVYRMRDSRITEITLLAVRDREVPQTKVANQVSAPTSG